MYLVYKHTSPSGKSYIGLTQDYDTRCQPHLYKNCAAFYAAICKYGWDNFLHEVLYDELTLDEANQREQQSINEYATIAPAGYNLTAGGKVCKMSAITKSRMSASHTGVKRLPFSGAAIQRMSDAKRGTVMSDEGKSRRRQLKLGTTLTEETKAKIGAKKKGIPQPEHTCAHCGIVTSYTNIKRWHNDKCKHR